MGGEEVSVAYLDGLTVTDMGIPCPPAGITAVTVTALPWSAEHPQHP